MIYQYLKPTIRTFGKVALRRYPSLPVGSTQFSQVSSVQLLSTILVTEHVEVFRDVGNLRVRLESSPPCCAKRTRLLAIHIWRILPCRVGRSWTLLDPFNVGISPISASHGVDTSSASCISSHMSARPTQTPNSSTSIAKRASLRSNEEKVDAALSPSPQPRFKPMDSISDTTEVLEADFLQSFNLNIDTVRVCLIRTYAEFDCTFCST